MLKTLLAALAVVVAMAAAAAPAQTMFRPIAVVNDSAITGFDLAQRAQILDALGFPAENKEALQAEALDSLINDRLKIQEATRLGVTASEEAIGEAIGRIAQRAGVAPEALIKGLQSRGVSEQALRDLVTADVVWQNLVRSRFNRRIDPGESEIDAEIAVMQQRAGASYRLAEIGLPSRDGGRTAAQTQALADKLYASLTQGGDFSAAVRKYSRSPSASKGGEVGWVQSERLPPELAESLASLEPGGVAPPIQVAGGMSILKLLEVRTEAPDASGAANAELRNKVTKRMQNERAQRLAEGLLQELRRDALIEMR